MPRIVLLLALLLLNSVAYAQEEPAELGEAGEVADAAQPPAIPAELQDPAFEQYIKLDSLAAACKTLEPAALADAGLQLAHGERVLFRSHKAISAQAVLDLAVKAATDGRDLETLERLAKASSALGKKKLADRIELAKKLAAQPRAAAPVQVDLAELTPDQVQYYQVTKTEIDRARIRGDKARLEEMDFHVAHSSLPESLRKSLAETIAGSQGAASDEETMAAVGKLAAASRVGVTGPFYFTLINQTNKSVSARVLCKRWSPTGGYWYGTITPKSFVTIPPGRFQQFVAMSSNPLMKVYNVGQVQVSNVRQYYRGRRRTGGGSYRDDKLIHATGWYFRQDHSKRNKLVYERHTPN